METLGSQVTRIIGYRAMYRRPGPLTLRAADSELLLLYGKMTSLGLASWMDCKTLEPT